MPGASSDSMTEVPAILTYRQLRRAAAALVDESDRSQSALARELDVHRSSVSRALNEEGPQFEKLQTKIIELLTPNRIEKSVRFNVMKRASASSGSSRDRVSAYAERLDDFRAPVLLLDAFARIRRASAGFCEAFSIDAAFLRGTGLFDHIGGPNADRLRNQLQAVVEDPDASFEAIEIDCTFLDLGRRMLHLNGRPILNGDETSHRFLLFVEDATEHVGQAEAMRTNVRELEQQIGEMKRLEPAMGLSAPEGDPPPTTD